MDGLKYRDGEYSITTEKDVEGYYCKAKVSVKNNKVSNVEWTIYDIDGRIFDDTYEKIYEGSPLYQQQCRDNLKGAVTFVPKLVETQDVDKVDSISGATWVNIIFKRAVNQALEKAKL